jgi:adenylate cyclase
MSNKKNLYKSIFTIGFLFLLIKINAQDQQFIDSLIQREQVINDDSTKADILLSVSKNYQASNFDSSLQYAKKALAIGLKLNNKTILAHSYKRIGIANDNLGNFQQALDNYEKSITYFNELKDKKQIGFIYTNIAEVNIHGGYETKALEHLFKALKVFETLKDSENIAWVYAHLATAYTNIGSIDEGLNYSLKGLKIETELGDSVSMGQSYNRIGFIYLNKKNYQEAKKYIELALDLAKKSADKLNEALVYEQYAELYNGQKMFDKTLSCRFICEKLFHELNYTQGLVNTYYNIAETYYNMSNYKESSKYLELVHKNIKENDDLNLYCNYYGLLSTLDSVQGRYLNSLTNYKLHKLYKDSMFNEENTKKAVQQQMQFDFDTKEAQTKTNQEKKMARQKLIRNVLLGGFLVVLMFSIIFFRQRNSISKEKKRSEELLLNILPEEVAEELKQKGFAEAKAIESVTVLFTDFKGFTQVSEKLSPKELVKEIDTCFRAFDEIISKYNIEKIKTIGDAYMCAGGLPIANNTHAQDIVKAAIEIRDYIHNLRIQKEANNELFFEIRIGIHTGQVVAGIVGIKKFAYDIWGDTVNTASRMESSGEAGKINISETTYEIVKDSFNCIYRGKIEAKNKGQINMYFLEGEKNI